MDARENSWATGTNPEVNSIYLRLAAIDPTITGHAINYAISGSGVVSLIAQAKRAVRITPNPGLFLVQSIDNDIRCDGTDQQNYEPYRQSLTEVLDTLTAGLPDARIFFVSQWADVKTYDGVVFGIQPGHITGPGPCDPVDPTSGKIVPAKELYLQGLVDDYFRIITETCLLYPACRTDGGANQKMALEAEDLTPDLDHLSVAGQAKMAAIEFDALQSADY